MKTCSLCREPKPPECFHRRAASKDGLSYICIECGMERRKIVYAQRKDYYKASASKWNRENPERRAQICRKSAEKHREERRIKAREYNRRIRLENIERERAKGRRATAIRRARERQNGGTISQEWWDALFEVFEFKTCLYCGAENCDLVMDHFVPVKLGGRTEVGNLVPCCRACNNKKRAMHPAQWLSSDAFASIQLFLRATAEAETLQVGAA